MKPSYVLEKLFEIGNNHKYTMLEYVFHYLIQFIQ